MCASIWERIRNAVIFPEPEGSRVWQDLRTSVQVPIQEKERAVESLLIFLSGNATLTFDSRWYDIRNKSWKTKYLSVLRITDN